MPENLRHLDDSAAARREWVFQDRRPHGRGRRAYRDVFTASPGKPIRTLWQHISSAVVLLLLMLLNFLVTTPVQAQSWDFTLLKHQSDEPGPTLLVIGGIQGDEPGGFNAAALLATEYKITRGEVWVVPNLNFESIIKRSRGVHGDMNRKFKHITDADPEYQTVQKIKDIIRDPKIDIILNLHDGSGFYSSKYIDKGRNPARWGQSLIIDQEDVDAMHFGQLGVIARYITQQANRRIDDAAHFYAVKNTHTRQGNLEMEKTLTYYAIENGKSAFGIEASKSFNTSERVYYHLNMVEEFMNFLGIDYTRNFALAKDDIEARINDNIRLALYDNRIRFDMRNVRKQLRYVPIKKDGPIRFSASNPLIAVLDNKHAYHVHYGNRSVTQLLPQYFQFDSSLHEIEMIIDGQQKSIQLGDIVQVQHDFMVQPMQDYRVNVIGFTRSGYQSEDGMLISKAQIRDEFSVDQQANLYRVEIYRADRFCGMILVDFTDQPVARLQSQSSQFRQQSM